MDTGVKAGMPKNVRRRKWPNVFYWTFLYTFVFMISTKYFVYEDGILGYDASIKSLYQHIALLASIIVGFILLRRTRLETPKRILCVLSALMILFGAVFVEARTNLIYLVFLAVLLGALADCSLLTYIYEMNNSERLFGIVLAHLTVAAVGFFTMWFGRTTVEFWWLIFSLAVAASVFSFFESKDADGEIAVIETFPKKLYLPLVLACVGGVVAVCSSMVVMEKISGQTPDMRYWYYLGALIGAVVFFVEYLFFPKPATGSLVTGFSFSVASIFCYVVGDSVSWVFSAAFAGATFNICMMNLYYILCNIIRKYRESHMLKIAPIVTNLTGLVIAVLSTVAFFFADDAVIRTGLALCLAGDVVVLATSVFWEKGVSVTAKQEEYVRFDTTLTKEQAYASVGLTEKEIEVAELLLAGLSLREIAKKLYVSENTAKTHRSSIYRKMRVSSKEELAGKMEHTI